MALLKGTLDVLVLKALSWGPMHGFEITSWLEERSGGRIDVVDAALIQALHRLEERGLLDADWGVTKNGRRARYYRLTRTGRVRLKEESEALVDHVNALKTILTARTTMRLLCIECVPPRVMTYARASKRSAPSMPF